MIYLDPSSKAIGYAVSRRGRLIAHGLLTPVKVRDTAFERAFNLREQLREVVQSNCITLPRGTGDRQVTWSDAHQAEWDADRLGCVIEVGGKVHGGKRAAMMGAGQYAYGEAVGMYLGLLIDTLGRKNVVRVPANEWTRGVPKARRNANLSLSVPSYDGKGDAGGDEADAIRLWQWWTERNRLRATA